jgi:hypothetical protein
MGSTFANLHVRMAGLDAVRARDELAGVMGELARAQGMVEATGAEEADREALFAGDDAWVSVYDEDFEPNQGELDRAAKAISGRLRADVVTVLVYDSDILDLRLFRDGQLVDQYQSNPGYFGKVSKAMRQAAMGRPSEWAPLLVPSASVDGLQAAWKARPVLAEETMHETAPLLGLSPERACVGFDDIVHEGRFDRRLRWRKRERARTEPLGPTRFDVYSGPLSHGIELSIGVQTLLAVGASSQGSASRGAAVVIWGEALDRGLVAIESIDLKRSGPDQCFSIAAPAIDRATHEGAPAWVARFSDFEVPPARPDALLQTNPKKYSEILFTTQVHAGIHLKGAAAGSGPLSVAIVPLGDPGGKCSWTVPIEVWPAPRKPLHARPGADGVELGVHAGRQMLFGLASMDLERASAAKAAASLIERWGALFAASGKLSILVESTDRTAKLRTSKVEMSGFFQGKKWAKLQNDLETAWVTSARRAAAVEPFPHPPHRFGDGFIFGGSPFAARSPEDPELPTLGFWLDVVDATETRVAEARALSESLLEEVMTKHQGIQALTGRWAWAPQYEPHLTPYEKACGVASGGMVLRRAWLTRHVRGVLVGTLWLGPDLTVRVPDVEALRAACPTRAVGSGVRIDVPDVPSLDVLEAVLEPLLPR